jgi:hypothetical protein
MAAVGLFYAMADRAVELPLTEPQLREAEDHIRVRFTDRKLFIDCDLPLYFAQRLHDGEDPRALFGDWRSSDRPPLQTGLFLMLSWLWDPWLWEYAPDPWCSYHLAGCVIQSVWVPAVWTLCRMLRLPRRRCGMVLLFVAFSGFALVNTVYCWPKMLAGSLALFAVAALLLGRGAARLPASVLAGAAGSLALLAHGGAIFTLLALALFALTPSLYPGWRASLAGIAAAAGLLAPWLAYQKWYDPPGDRLPKWHLAGVVPVEDERSFVRALWESYRATPLCHDWRTEWALASDWSEEQPIGNPSLVGKRIVNVQSLFVDRPSEFEMRFGFALKPEALSSLVRFRDAQLHHLFPALGLLNLGWLVFGWRLCRGGNDPADRLMLGLGLTGVLIWVLLMFFAGTTILHQGSYADVLLLMTGLAAVLCRCDAVTASVLLILHTAGFLFVWLFTTPGRFAQFTPNFPLLLVAAGAFVCLLGTALDGWDLRLVRRLRRAPV